MHNRFLPTWLKSNTDEPSLRSQLKHKIFMLRLANIVATVIETAGVVIIGWFLLKLFGG